MKTIKYTTILGAVFTILFTSCLKEDNVLTPIVRETKMYMTDVKGDDSLVTQAVKGKVVKFVVSTDADMVSVWPGGIRKIMKKKISDDGVTFADSLDMFNHPVLINSDNYSDYGLVKAKGFKTTLSDEGWYCTYTYPNAGEFELVVVVTNHGYQNADYKQAVYKEKNIMVK